MSAGCQECAQALGGKRDRVGPRHTDDVETLRPGGVRERSFQLSRRQKSRSA
jgi:hypothetical protein